MHRRILRPPVALAILAAFALASAPASPAQEPAGKRVALLVGVNKYEKRNFRDLEYAERDVEELAKVLRTAGYEVHLLTGSAQGEGRATLANIKKALQAVLKGRTKQDLVVVALAGHGLQIEVETDDTRHADSFYCPVDAQRGDSQTMLAIGGLFTAIDNGGGGQNILLVDACREDPTRGGRGLNGARASDVPEGVAVLFGCGSGQKTYETRNAGGGHGVFFHFVLEGLQGRAQNADHEVTWDALAEYVRKKTRQQAPVLMGDLSVVQSPNLIANLGDLPPVLIPAPSRPVAPRLKPLEVIENSIDMKLVLIPAGEFDMGSPAGEKDRASDETQHHVRLTHDFFLGQTEVTVGQFRRFVSERGYKTEAETDGQGGYGINTATGKFEGRDPKYNWRNPGFAQAENEPVVNVTWNDAQSFLKWLGGNEKAEYRLPTEAEWEYACRAGTKGRYSSGDQDSGLKAVANIADATLKAKCSDAPWAASWNDSYPFSAPVASFKPNAFKLFDMHGNVWEWCADSYGAYPTGTAIDPAGSNSGALRVVRGGGWFYYPSCSRAAGRSSNAPSHRALELGFRVARIP